jgi:two-component system, NtrC family, sensor kinase
LKLGTRLLMPLLPTATLIMSVYAAWALVEREETLAPEARRETEAYATALALAFDYALRDVSHQSVQEIINQVSRAPTVYGILVYDSAGHLTLASDPLRTGGTLPPSELRSVLASGGTAGFEREIEDQRVYSVLRAIRGPRGAVIGALEVAQPLSSIEAEKGKVRSRFLLNTVTLLAALTLVTLWLVRRVVGRPMERLVAAANALGSGNLSHRIEADPGGGELAQLAHEFNAMAGSLEAAQASVVRQGMESLALERRLREAEKLATIGNLAAGLAHEIAAPLNVISGRAELLLKREADPTALNRSLRIIVRQINRITTIVRNLLDFARRREPRLQRIDLGAVVEGVAEFLESELERGEVELVCNARGSVWVDGDPDLLHQVLVNLWLNAFQAMEDASGPRRLTVRMDVTESAAITDIEDTGPGFTPEVRQRMFEPFYTTKARGTGLGLVVARSIIEEHGGSLEAATASSGAGARFRITLPLAHTPIAAHA